MAYTRWLTMETGVEYRLPTAEKWEVAALGGSTEDQARDQEHRDPCRDANINDRPDEDGTNRFGCTDGFVTFAAVRTFRANSFGLYDMLGNAAEWTRTPWFDDLLAPRTLNYAIRGGSWDDAPAYIHPAAQTASAPYFRYANIGFRVRREVR